HEIRFGFGLAELLRAARSGEGRDGGGSQPRHAAHRDHVRGLWLAPGPRLSRWPASDGTAILRQLCITEAGPRNYCQGRRRPMNVNARRCATALLLALCAAPAAAQDVSSLRTAPERTGF